MYKLMILFIMITTENKESVLKFIIALFRKKIIVLTLSAT